MRPEPVRTAGLTAAAMVAFAANSLLCRAALGGGHADAASFTTLRLAGGALALGVLARWRGSAPPPGPLRLGLGPGALRLRDRLLARLPAHPGGDGRAAAVRRRAADHGRRRPARRRAPPPARVGGSRPLARRPRHPHAAGARAARPRGGPAHARRRRGLGRLLAAGPGPAGRGGRERRELRPRGPARPRGERDRRLALGADRRSTPWARGSRSARGRSPRASATRSGTRRCGASPRPAPPSSSSASRPSPRSAASSCWERASRRGSSSRALLILGGIALAVQRHPS